MTDFGALSLLPIGLAIVLAMVSRNVIFSLFSAIWLGGALLAGGDPLPGLLGAINNYLIPSVASRDHALIMFFALLVGGTIGILLASGATKAFVDLLSRFAKGPRSAMVLTWVSGLFIFFDDYANCLVVGSSMQPLYDRLKISRAKLAYIVDSTAAPVASIALMSTWVAFQLGIIREALESVGSKTNAYDFYLQSIPYNFYTLLTLVFVLSIAATGRDFGPMRKAKAWSEPPGRKQAWTSEPQGGFLALMTFFVPILLLVGVTFWALYTDGVAKAPSGTPFLQVVGYASTFLAMQKGGLAALSSAIFLSLLSRSLGFKEASEAMLSGMRKIFVPILVLILAWTLSLLIKDLGAAAYVTGLLKLTLPVFLLPTLIFVIAGFISFATGTSYGTMGLLMPIVIPLAFGMTDSSHIHLAAMASILSGAVFGDHCSPISDTTLMSSMGSGCDLIEHVKTQLPYALTTGAVAIIFGTIPAGLGIPVLPCLIAGSLACIFLVRKLGKIPRLKHA